MDPEPSQSPPVESNLLTTIEQNKNEEEDEEKKDIKKIN